MSIYGQPNSWQCGPFALKHALITLGIFTHEDRLTELAGSTVEGTDEIELARAAGAWGCDLLTVRRRHAWSAWRELRTLLARGAPVLLCLDQWDHWVTVVAEERDRVMVFDSHYDHPVLRIEPWAHVARRLAYRVPRRLGFGARRLYDLHPLVSRERRPARLALTLARARQLLELEHGALARTFDRYAERLLSLEAIGTVASARPLDRVLEERRSTILGTVADVHGVNHGAPERELKRLAFVAGLYGLRLDPAHEHDAVGRLAAVIAQLATEADAAPRAAPPSLATVSSQAA